MRLWVKLPGFWRGLKPSPGDGQKSRPLSPCSGMPSQPALGPRKGTPRTRASHTLAHPDRPSPATHLQPGTGGSPLSSCDGDFPCPARSSSTPALQEGSGLIPQAEPLRGSDRNLLTPPLPATHAFQRLCLLGTHKSYLPVKLKNDFVFLAARAGPSPAALKPTAPISQEPEDGRIYRL